MAVKKETTTEEVYGGPPAVGDTPTRKVGDPVPDTINLTDSGPDDPSDKPVKFKSPFGSEITVSSDFAEQLKNEGYSSK